MSATQTRRTAEVSDPVRLAVVQGGLVGVAREMGTIMERASYSSILNEGKDFSCAVFNRGGELVAEGEFVLVHLAAMHEAVQVLIRHFGDRWQRGDIALHNDPYEGGSHLPDINTVRPVFVGDEVVGYVATRAHYPDVGGTVPGSFSGEASSLFHEGVVIPPLLLARGDVLDEQLIEFWARNVRVARRLRADLMAQVASVRVGERGFLDLCERFGVRALLDVLEEIPAYGEAVMRSRVEAQLAGESEFFDFMDDAGPESLPVRIHLRVRVRGSDLEFDYSGSDGQVPCPINAPVAVVKSATYGAVKCLLVPELPLNSGMFRPLKVITREGSLTHPLAPAPVAAGNTNTSQRLFDMCLVVLGELFPGGRGGMAASYGANSDIGIGGHDARSGDEFVLYMMPVGGIGARPALDGESALINYMGNCSSQPVEVWESMYPLRVGEYRLRPDSAGPGRRRGGLGLRVSYEALADGIQASVFTERQRFAPFGLQLGQPAATGSYMIHRGELSLPIPTKTSGLWLQGGDRIVIETAGGGGFGDPFEREPELVAADVEDGLVSREAAAREYGVIIDQDGALDLHASQRARQNDQRPILRLPVDRIDEAVEALLLGAEHVRLLSIEEGQLLYCFNDRLAVYVPAAVDSAHAVTIPALVARTLGISVGETIAMRPLPSRWVAFSTDQLRRRFSARQRSGGE